MRRRGETPAFNSAAFGSRLMYQEIDELIDGRNVRMLPVLPLACTRGRPCVTLCEVPNPKLGDGL
jgi:hypothetical protein